MISAEDLKQSLINASSNISKHAQEVDSLNVFPVPDGKVILAQHFNILFFSLTSLHQKQRGFVQPAQKKKKTLVI